MVTRIGSQQRKTRYKYKRHFRQQGKLSLSKFFQEFAVGDKVGLVINSSVQYGRFYPRFYGLTGSITGRKQGSCYEVAIKDGNKDKKLLVHPIHLKKQNV